MECIIKGKVLVVPEGTVKIGFKDICNYIYDDLIEEILLPSTLEFIEDNTFFDFTEIKKINIPKSVIEIGSQAFWGMEELEELTITNNIRFVGKHAFCNCRKLTLMISFKATEIPSDWDPDFCANIKSIIFLG